MTPSAKEYDAKLDAKKRLTLRGASYDYYHVTEREDGIIILEPRELTVPFSVSENTLQMMDEAVHNLKDGRASDPVDHSSF